MKFFSGLIVGVVLAGAIPLALVWTGSLNMCASLEPSAVEKKVGTMAWENSMHKNAPTSKNPYADNADALKIGLAHYQENCFVCHAAPGVESSEIAKGMNPPPPMLDDVEDMTDGELFYLVKNGIRMTGMPAFGSTHTDEEIWKMVAFVRHLTKLTPEEQEMLRPSIEEEEHHHEETEAEAATEPAKESEEHEHKQHHH